MKEKEQQATPLRVYGGVAGDDRQVERRALLVEAGLDLLGAADGEPNLTVRGVCKQSGLAARYFYESFADRDALALAVFDHVADGIARSTLEAVTAVGPHDPRAQVQAGLGTIVRMIAEDPRRGRLLFSPALSSQVLLQRRVESTRRFAQLLGGQVQEAYGLAAGPGLELVTEFLVGGVAQTLTSWLNGSLDVTEEEIVERCSAIFLALAKPRR